MRCRCKHFQPSVRNLEFTFFWYDGVNWCVLCKICKYCVFGVQNPELGRPSFEGEKKRILETMTTMMTMMTMMTMLTMIRSESSQRSEIVKEVKKSTK